MSVDQPFTIIFSVKDQDKAEALFDNVLDAQDYAVKDGDGYAVYAPKSTLSGRPSFIFRSDVLIVTSDKTLVEAGGELTSKLSDESDFSTAVGLLPESQYNGVIYANTPALLASAMEDSMSRRDRANMEMFNSLFSVIKPQAYGLTILDDRSLTIDLVAPYSTDASSPMLMTSAKQPMNLDFAKHILAGTPLVAQGTDLYDNYESAIANFRTLAATMPSSSDMKPQDVEAALWGLGFMVRGLTGLETADALGWMTGDYALTLGFSASFSDAQSIYAVAQSMPIEFGLIVEATDADAAQKFYDGLTRSLVGFPDPRVTVSEETLGSGAGALSITIQDKNTPFPIELLAATGNGVFALGTRRTVEAALDPKNAGLSSDAAYVEASKYLLTDTNSLLYLSGAGLKPLARVMTQSGNPDNVRQQGKQIQAVLDLISSGSVSATLLPDNGGSLARLVWTLPE